MKFRENKPSRFKLSRKKNAQGSTLMVNGEICLDPDVVWRPGLITSRPSPTLTLTCFLLWIRYSKSMTSCMGGLLKMMTVKCL